MKVKLQGCFCSLKNRFFRGFFGWLLLFFALRQFWTENNPKVAPLTFEQYTFLHSVSGPQWNLWTVLHFHHNHREDRNGWTFEGNISREKSCATFFYLQRSTWKCPECNITNSQHHLLLWFLQGTKIKDGCNLTSWLSSGRKVYFL